MKSEAKVKELPTEDPWAPSVESTGTPIRTRVSTVLEALPGELDVAGEAMAGAMRAVSSTVSSTVSSAQDDSLLVGASMASGLAIGLLLGRGPRLLAAGAVLAAVSLGASLVQRHPARRRATFGQPVMA